MPPADQNLMEESFKKLLMGMLGDLDEKERQVLVMRFGLDGKEPHTLKEVGDRSACPGSASARSRRTR